MIDERSKNNGGIIFTEKIKLSVKINSLTAATFTTNPTVTDAAPIFCEEK